MFSLSTFSGLLGVGRGVVGLMLFFPLYLHIIILAPLVLQHSSHPMNPPHTHITTDNLSITSTQTQNKYKPKHPQQDTTTTSHTQQLKKMTFLKDCFCEAVYSPRSPTLLNPQTHITRTQLLTHKPKHTNTHNDIQIKTLEIKDNLITKYNYTQHNKREKQKKRKQRNQTNTHVKSSVEFN